MRSFAQARFSDVCVSSMVDHAEHGIDQSHGQSWNLVWVCMLAWTPLVRVGRIISMDMYIWR